MSTLFLKIFRHFFAGGSLEMSTPQAMACGVMSIVIIREN